MNARLPSVLAKTICLVFSVMGKRVQRRDGTGEGILRNITFKRLRLWLFLAGLATVSMASVALVQAPQPSLPSLAEFVPPGPLLYLEARDFASLIHDWQASPEKRLWLASANYTTFSRSRLYLRLEQAQKEFAETAGFPPNMSLVESAAGAESALALYDIGKLQFLYLTRMPSAHALQTLLGQKRGNYEPRVAAGLPYFLRVDAGSERISAFAITSDYLLLATREDLLAGALALLAARKAERGSAPWDGSAAATSSVAGTVRGTDGGGASPALVDNNGARASAPLSLRDEHWFAESIDAAQRSRSHTAAPDLRLVLNMKGLVLSPYFRSYWVQRNASKLKSYEAGISDLYRSTTELREEREFLPSQAPSQKAMVPGGAASNGAPAAEAGLDKLLRLVPDNAGFYRAWTAPRVDELLDLVVQKALSPRAQASAPTTIAPPPAVPRAGPGSESDLETRIDEAPLAPEGVESVLGPLRTLFENAQVRALLQVQSSRALADHVMVENDSVIVLVAASDWDGGATRRALQSAVENLWTTSRLGVDWVQRKARSNTFDQLNGLAPVAMATRGPYLLVASSGEALGTVLDRIAVSSGSGIGVPEPQSPNPEARLWYAAGFRHAQEREHFYHMTRLIDNASSQIYGQPAGAGSRQPQFFSDNIGSLSRTLGRIQSMSITVRDTGASESQTVVYDLGR